jgi:GrpB-like predicted nucleotidyltransferase (UPF0157 family)
MFFGGNLLRPLLFMVRFYRNGRRWAIISRMFEHVQSVIGSYASRPAACLEYDSRAVAVARSIAALVQEHLPQVCVEHVGSTSVPGCAGKGIVDLMIVVRDGEMAAVTVLLDQLGFQRQTGVDGFPETRPMRVGSLVHDGTTFLLHVHVIPASSPEVDEMRFFRACLRADPELRHVYVARKREILAGGVTDSLEYCRLKGEFIKEMLG